MKNTDAIIKDALNSGHIAATEAADAERERHKNQPLPEDGNQYAFSDKGAYTTRKGNY